MFASQHARPSDAEYFRARAIQEQVAAGRATSEMARKVHNELAMIYRFKAAMLASAWERWQVPEAESVHEKG